MRIKISYEINGNYIRKKIRDMLLAKSKLNQQNRNYDKKIYKQQIEELKKKLEDLTQAIEMLKTPNSLNVSERH